jgi:hypothetical protein
MRKLTWFFGMCILAMSCQDDQESQMLTEQTSESIIITQQSRGNATARLFTETGVNCDETVPFSIMFNSLEIGSGSVAIDSPNINISFDLSSNEWFMLDVKIFAGDCNAIPDPSEFPIQETFTSDDEVRVYDTSMPYDPLLPCGCVSAVATIARYNASTSQIESFEFNHSIDYCICEGPEEPEEPDDKDLRTQTPGGWGAPPSGNNPGVYLHANFASAFPSGLVVGCDYTITLTSAQAVTDFLPQGGSPASLTMSYVDPVNTPKSSNNPKNVLASHVVALSLSVTFDAWDEDFSESATDIGNAVITSGDFEGWTVSDVLAEAEKVLGGCSSDYSASELAEVLSAINESFIDGNKTSDFLENSN